MITIEGFHGLVLPKPATGWPADVRGASGPFELEPELVAVPTSTADVATLVRWAGATGRALTGRGAGTGMPGGNVTRHVLVDLRTHFRSVLALDPAGRSITVQPGVTVAEVEREAAAHGLTFPVQPSSAERCAVGGLVANNGAGPRTLEYGATRSWVMRAEVILADGRRVELDRDSGDGDPFTQAAGDLPPVDRNWPAVRKNASGYALDAVAATGRGLDLFVGSEGTLGLATEITLELLPAPQARATAVVAARDAHEVTEWALFAREVRAAACEFLGRRLIELAHLGADSDLAGLTGGAEALVLIELDGDAGSVALRVRQLGAAAEARGSPMRIAASPAEAVRLWGLRRRASPAIAEAASTGLVSMQFIEDSVVPPDRLGDYLTGVQTILARAETDAAVFGHAGDANVHVNPLVDVRRPDWRERVRSILESTVELVATLGGTLSGEHGDGRLRAPFLGRIWGDERARAFGELKRRLDPAGVLNPGVLVPVPGQDPLDGLLGEPPVAHAIERSES